MVWRPDVHRAKFVRMRASRSLVGAVTALSFVAQSTGLAYASPPQAEGQSVPPLPAPPPAGDAIYLKGGETIRGTLVEMLPNDHATLRLSTGQNAVVAWGQIDRIERQPFRGAPAGPIPAAPPPSGSAFVHLEAEEGIVLESIAPGSGRWALACTAPCDAEVPLADQFRVGGESVRSSRAFGLAASPGQHVVIRVSPASKGRFTAGIGLLSAGGAALFVGAVVYLVGAAGNCTEVDSLGACYARAPNGGVETAGGVTMLAGIGVMVVGAVLLASNTRTRATQTMSALFPPPLLDAAWLRTPTWNDTGRDALGAPKMTGAPIFTQSF